MTRDVLDVVVLAPLVGIVVVLAVLGEVGVVAGWFMALFGVFSGGVIVGVLGTLVWLSVRFALKG